MQNNYFYGYVLFTMNKQRSLELCETYKNYFKVSLCTYEYICWNYFMKFKIVFFYLQLLQTEIDDKLGINSFLVQPIQRMARYPLLLQQFINVSYVYQRGL